MSIKLEEMAYTRLSAAEAAAMINDQDTIGLSGFTPNGVPKATFRELSKRAVAEHEAGRPFQVGILTGASTSQSIEGDMAAAHAIKFRAPFLPTRTLELIPTWARLIMRICTSATWLSACAVVSMAK